MFRLPFVLLVLVLGGCDSGIDAWEGILNADIDQDGDIAGDENGGAAGGGGIAFPDGVDRVYDLTVVGTTLWLWANDTTDDVDGPVLIPVSISTGEPGNSVTIDNRPGLLNAGSEVTWDGSTFWFTSDGNVAQAELYQVQRDGTVSTTIACPFAGFAECDGLAWDGVFLWTGEKNGTRVTRFNPIPGSSVPSPFAPWGTTTGTLDFLFAQGTVDSGQALVVRDRVLYWIGSRSESATEGPAVEFDKGGANSGTIWYASNSDRRLLSRGVPPPPEPIQGAL